VLFLRGAQKTTLQQIIPLIIRIAGQFPLHFEKCGGLFIFLQIFVSSNRNTLILSDPLNNGQNS